MAELVRYRYFGGLSDDHQQVPCRPCLMERSVGVGVENGIRKGPPKTDAFCVVSVFRCSWSFHMNHGVREIMSISNGTTHCGQTTYIAQSAVEGGCRECSS